MNNPAIWNALKRYNLLSILSGQKFYSRTQKLFLNLIIIKFSMCRTSYNGRK